MTIRYQPKSITPRRRAVLVGMANGRTAAQIAREMVLSEGTIRTHINLIFRVLNVQDRGQAVAVGMKLGYILPEQVVTDETCPGTAVLPNYCRCPCPGCKNKCEMHLPKGSERSEDELMNDPFDLWGRSPSYRCYVGRHKDCEIEGAETGCTCFCGHQEPVCACGSRDVTAQGELIHYVGCPAYL